MLKSLTLLSFVGLTSSALIGSSFYGDSKNYLEASNLVTDNKANSLTTKLVQNDKDLTKVQSNIDELNSELSIYELDSKSSKAWKSKIDGHDLVNNGRLEKLLGKIQWKEKKKSEYENTYEKAIIKAKNIEENFPKYIKEAKQKKEKLNSQIQKNQNLIEQEEKRKNKRQEKIQEWKNRMEELKKDLEKEDENIKKWQNAIDKYEDNRSKIQKEIQEREDAKKQFMSEQEKVKLHLKTALKNKGINGEWSKELEEQILSSIKTLENLNQQKQTLDLEKLKVWKDILEV